MEIEINGIKYKKIEKQPRKQLSKSALSLLMVASAFGGLTGENNYNRQRPSVDLINEFKLIQNKKSSLSKSDRDWVVFQFNKVYKPV